MTQTQKIDREELEKLYRLNCCNGICPHELKAMPIKHIRKRVALAKMYSWKVYQQIEDDIIRNRLTVKLGIPRVTAWRYINEFKESLPKPAL